MLFNLSEKQREALLAKDKRLLILAGAGSGKTNTLIQKILYTLQKPKIRSSNILTITFTKNAANEVVDRLILAYDAKGIYKNFLSDKKISKEEKDDERGRQVKSNPHLESITVKTFHAFCYQILKEASGSSFDNKFRVLTDNDGDGLKVNIKDAIQEKPNDIFAKVLKDKCKSTQYLLDLKRYILDFCVDVNHFRRPAKSSTNTYPYYYTALRGHRVRSKSERDIADWLYRRNIKYEYEKEINLVGFSFKPDFYIPQADLYIEHVSGISYNTTNKDREFEIAGRNHVKTYESIMEDSSLFNLRMEEILKDRLSISSSQVASLKFDEEFRTYHDKVFDFIKMTHRAMSMIKSGPDSFEEISEKASKHQHERVRMFYKLAIPIMKGYKEYCVDKSYLDFDDLLIEAINLLENNVGVRKAYHDRLKYILVDEFQDVNALQVKLINLLLNTETQLFCVGDDWQSIYGFRGSDVEYIVNFNQYFNAAKIIKLDVNYRNNEAIVGASNEVIKNNKFKIDKNIVAHKETRNKIQIFRALEAGVDDVAYLLEKVKQLIDRGYNGEDILILYPRSKMLKPYAEALKMEGMRVTTKTIHASKGLEAKAVFVIGLKDGVGGFPEIWLDDSVFTVIKDVEYDMLMEEQRRLFYVALTRAKEELYLITVNKCESAFIDEIPSRFYINDGDIADNTTNTILVCIQCNSELKKAFKFCPECGHDVSNGSLK
ncbi:zinc-ribbon family protein [Chitinophaga sp. YR627]|uniref:UvrD-helicase domain-containing protein n=1 Tax=Chitinophaga sp. YR627 TaxID=1881041 RepID=UPI0008DF2125|nr:UvrD-helicase domain-containing protein [Chitinophaga sp. YR627]SFN21279.1 zinc-ribbon family protein [Chitinophaga sp. YR627]